MAGSSRQSTGKTATTSTASADASPAHERVGSIGAALDSIDLDSIDDVDIRPQSQRQRNGQFAPLNTASLIHGANSKREERRVAHKCAAIAQAIVADQGFSEADAPQALALIAKTIAQAAVTQASAFDRMLQVGGPLSARGRARRCFLVWLQASDRLEKGLRLVGLKRTPKPTGDPLSAVRAAVEKAWENV